MGASQTEDLRLPVPRPVIRAIVVGSYNGVPYLWNLPDGSW